MTYLEFKEKVVTNSNFLNQSFSMIDKRTFFSYFFKEKESWFEKEAFKNFDPDICFPVYKYWKLLPESLRTPNSWGVVLGISRRSYQWTFLDECKAQILMPQPLEAWKYCEHWFEVHERAMTK